jgi:hypothetical protein
MANHPKVNDATAAALCAVEEALQVSFQDGDADQAVKNKALHENDASVETVSSSNEAIHSDDVNVDLVDDVAEALGSSIDQQSSNDGGDDRIISLKSSEMPAHGHFQDSNFRETISEENSEIDENFLQKR